MSLQNNIKKFSQLRGIPLYKIEEELGIATGSISKWKEIMPSVDKALGVAKILETTVEELMKED
jgi:transcriptional regulator with XRE-family HTH domain